MKTQGDDLICYKHISIDAHGKLKFFLEKQHKRGDLGCFLLKKLRE